MAVRDPLGAPVNADPLTAQPAAAAGPEAILGHRFARPELLREALTHRSAVQGRQARRRGAGSNERLEFLGDRVLGLVIAEWLVERFPGEQEGELGRRLADLVAQPTLVLVAESIGLAGLLAIAPGEERAGVARLDTVRADAIEAVIGAIYLDGGLEPARRFVRRAWRKRIEAQGEPPKDAKTALQEWAQGRGHPLPAYTVAGRSGPPHAPRFVIEVAVAGRAARGEGSSKREAERRAAEALLALLG